MNITMLYVLLAALIDEIQATHEKLGGVVTSLQNMANNPADTGLQQAFEASLNDLYAFLRAAPSNAVSGLQQHLMAQIGVSEYLGGNLMSRIERSVQKNGIVIGGLMTDVEILHRRVETRLNAANSFISGCNNLGIDIEKLDAGEGVFTFVIPGDYLQGDMVKLSKEVKTMEQFVGNVSELMTHDRKSGYKVRSIGTGSVIMEVWLPSALLVAGLLKILHLAMQCYRELLAIKKARQSVSDLANLPSKGKVLELIDKDIEASIKASINKSIDSAVQELTATGKAAAKGGRARASREAAGRTNELKTELRRMFKSILKRLENGFKFDVEMGEDESSEEESGKTKPPAIAKIREEIPKLHEEMRMIGDQKVGIPLLSMEAESDGDKPEQGE